MERRRPVRPPRLAVTADWPERRELTLIGPELEHALLLLLGSLLDRLDRVWRVDLAPAFEAVRSEDEEAKSGHLKINYLISFAHQRMRLTRVPTCVY